MRRRARYVLGLVLAGLLVYLLAGSVAAPYFLQPELPRYARDALDAEASIGQISVNPSGRWVVSGKTASYRLLDDLASRPSASSWAISRCFSTCGAAFAASAFRLASRASAVTRRIRSSAAR
jgi:hypothetical protein